MADFSQALDGSSSQKAAAPNIASGSSQPTSGAASSTADDKELRKQFDNLDKDKSGFIDKGDLKKMMSFVPESLIKKAISFADKDKDGKVSFEEYKQIRAEATKLLAKFGGKKK